MRKAFKWEFWPQWMFYLPVYVVYLWYSLRARTMMFFSTVNPCMYMSGFIDYSKYDILQKLPINLIPKSFLLPQGTGLQVVLDLLKNEELSFPFIIKPNKGQRGFAVEKISTETELKKYLNKYNTELLLQEYIDYPLEFGVMYYRHPASDYGTVSSVVKKEFLYIEGDGKSSIKALIKNSPRGKYYQKLLFKRYRDDLNQILRSGEKKKLVEIGNHCKGSTFYNANNLINAELTAVFENISNKIEGFHFGRYDLRVESIEKLYSGDFKVVELNGVNSEPAHIYDPKMSIFKAWRAMFKHWKVIYKIGTYNHKHGVAYMSLKEGYRTTRQHFKRRKKEVIS